MKSVEKALGLARTMKWNGKNPVVKLINGTYEKGIKLTQKAMKQIEKMIERMHGIEFMKRVSLRNSACTR